MPNISEDLLNQYSEYMLECIAIAKKADNEVHPPYVGCLILNKEGKKVSEGWRHLVDRSYLAMHAERHAVQQAREPIKGGTLITTLEPCKAQRNTDSSRRRNLIFRPCSRLIVDEGIKRVVYGRADPSDCGGAQTLRCNKIEVIYLKELESLIERELFAEPIRAIRERRNGYRKDF